jgi:hypothetical protein
MLSDAGSRAWRATDVADATLWRRELPQGVTRVMAEAQAEAHARRDASGDARTLCPALGPVLDGAAAALDGGPGFVVLDRLELEGLDAGAARRLYLAIAQAVGKPLAQDRGGQLFCDVIDAAPPPAPGEKTVPGSRQADLPFHTDNAFGAIFPDYVGMLCIRRAATGGLFQLVSAYTVLQELERCDVRLLRALEQPVPFAAGRIMRAGEETHAAPPVVSWDNGELVFRYLRLQIQEARLPREQVQALDAVDEVLASPRVRVEIAMREGEMCYFSNRWLLHSRTRFENAGPLRPRHHVRLWLSRS